MKTSETKKLNPEERFWYWIKERHTITLKRKKKLPAPWTDDEVLQNYFFTNPYRENDKVTQWFKENIRGPLKDDERVLMATVIFRWFNRIETGEVLVRNGYEHSDYDNYGLLEEWNGRRAKVVLKKHKEQSGLPYFTGAFMIKAGNGPPGCKMPMVCDCITEVWKKRKHLLEVCAKDGTMQGLWAELKKFRGLGGFMSYEIVCDLRYTYLLEDSSDKMTWCNMGPGARRGMNRLLGKRKGAGLEDPISKDKWEEMTQYLLTQSKKRIPRSMPKFEMREVEHSLCEVDKYSRLLFNEGKSKRKYNGRH